MLYNINNQTLSSDSPSTIILENGTIITGPINDIQILANAGYYTVRNDGPNQPENTIEDVSLRMLNLDKPYADITRVWMDIPVIIPETVSARQIRLWLIQNNISLDSVNDEINSIEDSTLRDSIAIEWEYAPYIERSHPMLVPLAQSLGLSESDIDRAFTEAATI